MRVESLDAATPVLPLADSRPDVESQGESPALSAKASPATRLIALGLAAGCLAGLLAAAWLPPNPAGYGSHTGLGLQSCQFLDRTGVPCPGCGMTTSFTWFVRGNFAASVYVQPMGAALALLACACVWVGFYIALTGRPAHRLLQVLPGRYYYGPLLALALAAWAWKIFIHLKGLDGWR
jgi:hypothetical protein